MNIIQWSKTALKQIAKIDRRYQKAIKDKVQELADFPDVYLDLKKLKGSDQSWRLRMGNYRILFEVIDGEPKIIEAQEIKKQDEQTYRKH